MERQRYRIQGIVQGVGFRWWARNEAQALGLRGTVRNLADGSVETELEGAAAAVAEMTRRLRAGPPGARVTRCDPLPPTPDELPPDFRIVR
jgi:acylphosphatase